ncbi:MAG: 23S rRNA (pseudouridine(1915)-N(3))-methyltransferase RlmH [Pseudomonadota bacterium]
MKLSLVAVGRLKDGPERTLFDRYRDRSASLAKGLGVKDLTVIEIPESRAGSPGQRQSEEGEALLKRVGSTDYCIAFDERGKDLTSQQFAKLVARERDAGRADAFFIIGGADGLSEAVRTRANVILSFGSMTLPHQIVRILVAEQIYRTLTILAGHPYHKP